MLSSANSVKNLYKSWHARYQHLPFFRRFEFLAVFFLFLLIYTFSFLPSMGRPASTIPWINIFFYYFLAFSFVILVITDREKPIWIKRVSSLTIVALFFWLFYLYSGTQWDKINDKFLNFAMLEGVWPMYLTGLSISLRLTLISGVLAVSIGLVIGILRSLRNPVMEIFLAAYIDFFRAMPLIALMIVVFYALPFIGINLDPFPAAVASITLMYSAYIAEIFRAGIQAIHYGQFDAAKALGLPAAKIMSMIILPQAVRIIIPPLTSSLVGILKDSAIAYVISLPELLTQANQAVGWKMNPTPLIVSSLLYLAILLPATRFTGYLETRSKRWIKKKS
jgi:His/Glu/Gln/Arg/opine family amino acid ABC transporter permease subunit